MNSKHTFKNDFTKYLSADTIKAIAQNLYDNKNFHGLNEDERSMLEMCERDYTALRNEPIPLTYSCPA